MHGLALAVEKRIAKQEASAQRAELQKQVRDRRTLERESARLVEGRVQASESISGHGSLSAEEIERRRIERRKARRRGNKR